MAKKKPKAKQRIRTPMELLALGIVSLAHQNGAACLEFVQCRKCNMPQYLTHPFAEALKCIGCGDRIVSCAPRPIARGEVTADHLMAQLRTLLSVNDEGRHGVDSMKIDDFPVEVRSQVTAKCAAEVRRALKSLVDNAEVMAGSA